MGKSLAAGVVMVALLGMWGCNRGAGEAPTPPAAHTERAGSAPHDEAGGTDGRDEASPKPAEGDESKPHGHPGEAAPDSKAAGSGEAAGSIVLSPEARANIGLETATAEIRPIERTLTLNATIQVDPDREAFVSSRVQGKVTSVRAKVGDRVAKGQTLVVLQSLQIAETPPMVEVPSPLEGFVLERTVTTGETIDPAKSLLHIADLSHVLAQAEVYEADVGSVRRSQSARLRVTSYPDRVFAGRVVRLADAIDPERRTLRVWIDVPNTPDRLLKPGMFGQVVLVLARSASAVAVPNEAVQIQGPEQFVFVRNGEAFQRQPIVVGDRDDRYTAIKSGVVEGDEVVTRGAAQLATLASQPAGGGVQDESKPHGH
jgi:multidrug efflux pump subunit AcrA (membrane-fusion protein)